MVEALVALVLFLPGIALYTDKLKDVTYRGELGKRSVTLRSRLQSMNQSRRADRTGQ